MMRAFEFDKTYHSLLSADVVALIGWIHEYKGEMTLFMESKADVLMQLKNTARFQSTEASNKMEGIYTSDLRFKGLMQEKTMPRTCSEKEIAGYRDVLATIHENHDYILPKPTMILQLHRDLYKFSSASNGGSYKNTPPVVKQQDVDNYQCMPVPEWETPQTVDRLCTAFESACQNAELDPLLLIPMFILDFLCIHPFNEGNGRMSRLLTLLLLYRAGYTVGKYISLEKLIEQSKETYDEALQQSSFAWQEGENNYLPFVRYLLGIIATAYRDFSSYLLLLVTSGLSKPNRVREIIKGTIGRVTKTEIMHKCPDISQVTIQRTLNELVKAGDIIKIGGGRYTSYAWNKEDQK